MVMKVFSVYDEKGAVFNVPFFFPTTGQAVRAFKDLANDTSSAINRHPEDYELCYIGRFDDATGKVEAAVVERLGHAKDYIEPRVADEPVRRLGKA